MLLIYRWRGRSTCPNTRIQFAILIDTIAVSGAEAMQYKLQLTPSVFAPRAVGALPRVSFLDENNACRLEQSWHCVLDRLLVPPTVMEFRNAVSGIRLSTDS